MASSPAQRQFLLAHKKYPAYFTHSELRALAFYLQQARCPAWDKSTVEDAKVALANTLIEAETYERNNS